MYFIKSCIVLYCDGVPAANVPGCTAAEGLFSFLLAPPGVSTRDPSSEKEELLGREMTDEFLPENARLPRNIQRSFTCLKSTTWDKGFTSLPKEDVLRIFLP